MTDIVKRLRKFNGGNEFYTNTRNSLLNAAADEIERLRCALAHITNIKNEMYGGDWDEIEHARTIARAALEEGK